MKVPGLVPWPIAAALMNPAGRATLAISNSPMSPVKPAAAATALIAAAASGAVGAAGAAGASPAAGAALGGVGDGAEDWISPPRRAVPVSAGMPPASDA